MNVTGRLRMLHIFVWLHTAITPSEMQACCWVGTGQCTLNFLNDFPIEHRIIFQCYINYVMAMFTSAKRYGDISLIRVSCQCCVYMANNMKLLLSRNLTNTIQNSYIKNAKWFPITVWHGYVFIMFNFTSYFAHAINVIKSLTLWNT